MRAGEALLLQPNTDYTLASCEEMQAVHIAFNREGFYRSCLSVIEGCPMLAGFFIGDGENSDMTFLHFQGVGQEQIAQAERMVREHETQRPYSELLLYCGLMNLMLELCRSCRVQASVTRAPSSGDYERIMAYLVRHCNETSLTDVAAAFNYHPNTIGAILRRNTGKSFAQLRSQIRLGRAARLLSVEGVSTREAAERCGYANMSNFYAQFVRQYGMTPGEYARAPEEERRRPCG